MNDASAFRDIREAWLSQWYHKRFVTCHTYLLASSRKGAGVLVIVFILHWVDQHQLTTTTTMRFSAIIPILLCAAALVLSLLCLFAGSSKSFMQEYAIVTLNTSQIGQNFFNTSQTSSNNPLTSWIKNITNSIGGDVNAEVASFAKDLGLHDFYNAHLMDYCEGYYVPGPVPNATLSASEIHENVTSCSNKTAAYTFDPRSTLQRELNASGHSNINLENNLNWPSAIDTGLHALRVAQIVTFILYCVGIGMIGIAFILAVLGLFLGGRVSAFINVTIDVLAFLVIGSASAISTAVAVKATNIINKYGDEIGVSATKGNKFMIITWVATGLMLVASLVWCVDCIAGRRNHRYEPKGKEVYKETTTYRY